MRTRDVTLGVVDEALTVRLARELARKLRDAKASHPWTPEECDLLARLCVLLRVEERIEETEPS